MFSEINLISVLVEVGVRVKSAVVWINALIWNGWTWRLCHAHCNARCMPAFWIKFNPRCEASFVHVSCTSRWRKEGDLYIVSYSQCWLTGSWWIVFMVWIQSEWRHCLSCRRCTALHHCGCCRWEIADGWDEDSLTQRDGVRPHTTGDKTHDGCGKCSLLFRMGENRKLLFAIHIIPCTLYAALMRVASWTLYLQRLLLWRSPIQLLTREGDWECEN